MDEYENIGPAVNADTPLQPPPPDGDKIKSENVRDKSNDEKVATKKSGLSLKGSEYAIDKPKSVETTTQTKKKSDKAKSGTKSGDKAEKSDTVRHLSHNVVHRILMACNLVTSVNGDNSLRIIAKTPIIDRFILEELEILHVQQS
ncbi:hypothetical protein KIN20_026239 [Parelaphostrongylus tenuis]|uniref:Uncharacterized protein n=1 Tax=Parelaphostrongylus tenuis TaxID=148309 RepID=A0AAD5QUY8_PARTN|nr:hypothetical protein KIN20_026239 [Parelaphostrongylus tenuis]